MAEKTPAKVKPRKKAAEAGPLAFVSLPTHLLYFLSFWLQVDYDDLLVAQHLLEKGGAYQAREIPKGKGSKEKRLLYVPIREMKTIQAKLMLNFLSFIPVHPATRGCRQGTSFVMNARHHSGFASSVYSLDLRHAFPSVTRKRAHAHLKGPLNYQVRQFGHPLKKEEVDQLLEAILDLVIFRDSLPQGAPSSPMLLNIVCMLMDQEITRYLFGLEGGRRFRYSRYVDDLTISSDTENGLSPEERKAITDLVTKCGFHPHPDKEHYVSRLHPGQSANVTGINIHADGRTTLSRKTLNRYRAHLTAICTSVAQGTVLTDTERGEIHGILGFLGQVYGTRLPAMVAVAVQQAREVVRGNPDPTPE